MTDPTVYDIIKIYLNKAIEQPMNSPEKIQHITVLFEYLLLDDVKSLLWTPPFEKLRHIILKKTIEFKNTQYLQANAKCYYHCIAALDEMQSFLHQLPSLRRSERLKHKFIATMYRLYYEDRTIKNGSL